MQSKLLGIERLPATRAQFSEAVSVTLRCVWIVLLPDVTDQGSFVGELFRTLVTGVRRGLLVNFVDVPLEARGLVVGLWNVVAHGALGHAVDDFDVVRGYRQALRQRDCGIIERKRSR